MSAPRRPIRDVWGRSATTSSAGGRVERRSCTAERPPTCSPATSTRGTPAPTTGSPTRAIRGRSPQNLRQEVPFAALPEAFEDVVADRAAAGAPVVDAVVANPRTVYLFAGRTRHVARRPARPPMTSQSWAGSATVADRGRGRRSPRLRVTRSCSPVTSTSATPAPPSTSSTTATPTLGHHRRGLDLAAELDLPGSHGPAQGSATASTPRSVARRRDLPVRRATGSCGSAGAADRSRVPGAGSGTRSPRTGAPCWTPFVAPTGGSTPSATVSTSATARARPGPRRGYPRSILDDWGTCPTTSRRPSTAPSSSRAARTCAVTAGTCGTPTATGPSTAPTRSRSGHASRRRATTGSPTCTRSPGSPSSPTRTRAWTTGLGGSSPPVRSPTRTPASPACSAGTPRRSAAAAPGRIRPGCRRRPARPRGPPAHARPVRGGRPARRGPSGSTATSGNAFTDRRPPQRRPTPTPPRRRWRSSSRRTAARTSGLRWRDGSTTR